MAGPLKMLQPGRVRYIKLGEGGKWEEECIENGIIRIGFDSARGERLRLCREARWDELSKSLLREGKSKGTATRFANELRLFFEDDGTTLWITFRGERLYWGFTDPATPPQPHADGRGVWRTIKDNWSCRDIRDPKELTKARLSGALNKLAAYRGTSCDLDADAKDYAVRRINGQKIPQVERAIAASAELQLSLPDLMRKLTWQDFETLVDLVFSRSGWQRVGRVGGTQKTVDLDLILPSTGQKAFVQVKAKTTSAELAEYIRRREDGPHELMFYVFHSGDAATGTVDDRVRVIGPEELAEMVMDAGLVSWLVGKVS